MDAETSERGNSYGRAALEGRSKALLGNSLSHTHGDRIQIENANFYYASAHTFGAATGKPNNDHRSMSTPLNRRHEPIEQQLADLHQQLRCLTVRRDVLQQEDDTSLQQARKGYHEASAENDEQPTVPKQSTAMRAERRQLLIKSKGYMTPKSSESTLSDCYQMVHKLQEDMAELARERDALRTENNAFALRLRQSRIDEQKGRRKTSDPERRTTDVQGERGLPRRDQDSRRERAPLHEGTGGEHQAEVARLQQQISDLNNENRSLKLQCADSHHQLDDSERLIAEQQQSIDAFAAQMHILRYDLNELRATSDQPLHLRKQPNPVESTQANDENGQSDCEEDIDSSIREAMVEESISEAVCRNTTSAATGETSTVREKKISQTKRRRKYGKLIREQKSRSDELQRMANGHQLVLEDLQYKYAASQQEIKELTEKLDNLSDDEDDVKMRTHLFAADNFKTPLKALGAAFGRAPRSKGDGLQGVVDSSMVMAEQIRVVASATPRLVAHIH